MNPTLVSIAIFIVFIVWLQSSAFLPPLTESDRPRREWIEIGALVLCMLAVPFLTFNMLWFTGWVSPYLILCLLAPLVLEGVLRRRNPALIGFRKPEDVQAMTLVGGLLLLFVISRVLAPVIAGSFANFEWRRFTTVSLLLPFLEEVLFRGLLQTRLQSAIKSNFLPCIMTGVFYGLYHGYVQYLVPGVALGEVELLQITYLIVFSILLGFIFRKTRSLLPSFLVHVLNNFSF
jgi:membrane protease YdiL (CAAX protease family)